MPRSRLARIAVPAASAVGLLVVGYGLRTQSAEVLHSPGGLAITAGSVAALSGTYLALLCLLLVARVPLLERSVGQDTLVGWHRSVAPWTLVLIGLHVALVTLGYAQADGANVFSELWTIVTTYPWLLPAAAGAIGMVTLGVVSWRPIRRRMNYETWWVTHLYFYLAVGFAFEHQVVNGTVFPDHPLARWAWTGLYVAVAAALVTCRALLPVARSLRYGLRVSAVVRESADVVSVYVTGRDLHAMPARGGQFFGWRFMTRKWWWQAHPYSLSAAPDGRSLRITVKGMGDHSKDLALLRPGTRVLAEGPYGVFTADARQGDQVVAIAGGVGIVPVRAMLDDLPLGVSVTLLYRVSEVGEAPLRTELEALVTARGWRLWYLQGERAQHPLDVAQLTQLAPELTRSDVYVCGPEGFSARVLDECRSAGLPEDRLHHESFAMVSR
jgi:predicted ferric reductase